jgi:hypothetical protein
MEPCASHRAEADRLCSELRGLFCNNVDCFAYELEVKVFGSICNNTHLPMSDSDIAVIPKGCAWSPRPGKGPTASEVCDALAFRAILLAFLKQRYGDRLCCEQRRAILLCGEGGRRQADIVVLIPRLWQYGTCPRCRRPQCSHGYELRSTCDRQVPIATWPEQHRDNALTFDRQTDGRYKRVVRAAKALLRSEIGAFPEIAPCLPPVLIESLFATVPVGIYRNAGPCPYAVVRAVLCNIHRAFLENRARQFRELSGLRDLFDPVQTWTIDRVHTDIAAMLGIIG